MKAWLFAIAVALSGCATVNESAPPPKPVPGVPASVTVSEALPDSASLPQQSAVAPDTKYVVIQSAGGSVFLGPILGSMNISGKTREMAARYRGSVFAIDPTPVASMAVKKAGVPDAGQRSAYVLKPFVFVQHCDDGRFRLSLVFHVQSNAGATPWVERYIYDLPTSYDASRFGALGAADIASYQGELSEGAAILTSLMQRDLAGQLPKTGKAVSYGSLYIIGNKLGGMGIYTKPEDLHFKGQLIEETDTYVTVRLDGHMHNTGVGGGLAFGVHRSNRNLVHTLSPAE